MSHMKLISKVRGHSYIDFHGKVRHLTFWVYPQPHQNVTLKMKPCLVQLPYLTMSWLPLQSVGTACSIYILQQCYIEKLWLHTRRSLCL